MAKTQMLILGLPRAKADLKRFRKRVIPGLATAMRVAAEVLTGAAKKQFVGSRTRALYKVSRGRLVRRVPPRPVTSPPDKLGVFTGYYRRAIGNDVVIRGRSVIAEIGPLQAVPYAPTHEFGRGVPARPVLKPAFDAKRDEVLGILQRTIRQTVKP